MRQKAKAKPKTSQRKIEQKILNKLNRFSLNQYYMTDLGKKSQMSRNQQKILMCGQKKAASAASPTAEKPTEQDLKQFLCKEYQNWQQLSDLLVQTDAILNRSEANPTEIKLIFSQIKKLTRDNAKTLKKEINPNSSSSKSQLPKLPSDSLVFGHKDDDNMMNLSQNQNLRRIPPKTELEIWPTFLQSKALPNLSLLLDNKSNLIDSEKKFFLSEREYKPSDNTSKNFSSISLDKKQSSKTLKNEPNIE